MGTGDEETRRFFKHSSVQVLLCPRSARKGSWAKQQVGCSLIFSLQIQDVILIIYFLKNVLCLPIR